MFVSQWRCSEEESIQSILKPYSNFQCGEDRRGTKVPHFDKIQGVISNQKYGGPVLPDLFLCCISHFKVALVELCCNKQSVYNGHVWRILVLHQRREAKQCMRRNLLRLFVSYFMLKIVAPATVIGQFHSTDRLNSG
jgi:hypothetical protein